jgi:hypothetical protein
MNKKIVGALLVCMMILVSGCEVTTSGSGNKTVQQQTSHPWIERWYDEEAGVVCWMWPRPYGVGLSCLPIEQTQLSPSDFANIEKDN